MPSKSLLYSIAIALLANLTVAAGVGQAAGLLTLFTTPEERQIINSNRYKSDRSEPAVTTTAEPVAQQPVQQLIREEVTRQFRVSGITISRDGLHTVWINSIAYQDGEQLDDGSKIKVMADNEVRARITAPDGKHYYATSGQTVDVTYLAPVEN